MWVIAICIVRSGFFRVVFAGSPPTLSARFNYCALDGASTSLRKRCARSYKLRCMFDIRSLIGVQLPRYCILFAEGFQHSMTERPSHAYSTTRAWRVGSVGDASTAA